MPPTTGVDPTVPKIGFSRVYNVNDFAGSDTTKFKKAFAKACAEPGTTVYIPWIGRPWVIEDEISALRVDNDYCIFNVVADPVWCNIDFHLQPGQDCFKTLGYKQGTWQDVMIRVFSSNNRGFVQAGTPQIRSTGGAVYRNCRVQPMNGSSHITGFHIGESGDDFSNSVWEHCTFYGTGYSTDQWNPNHLVEIASLGHVGFQFIGFNNCYQRMTDCVATGAVVGVTQLEDLAQEKSAGATGLVVDNFGTTGCCLVFQANGGMPMYIRGGRHELSGALLSHGNPRGWQPGNTVVTVRDIIGDDWRPTSGSACKLYESGAVISLRSGSKYRFEGLAGVQSGNFGTATEKLDKALLLAHNNSKGARVVFDTCNLQFDVMKPVRKAGTWTICNEGLTRVFSDVVTN